MQVSIKQCMKYFARFPDQGVQGGGLLIEAKSMEEAKDKLIKFPDLDDETKASMVNFLTAIEDEGDIYTIMY